MQPTKNELRKVRGENSIYHNNGIQTWHVAGQRSGRKCRSFLNGLSSQLSIGASGHAGRSHGDAQAGEKVFKNCSACHTVGPGAKNKVGPHLNDVIGRVAGSVEGFKYSKAMKTAGEEGIVWTSETLTPYLTNPKDFIKGTKMAFAGLKKAEEIADVIAYLRTFSHRPAKQDSTAPAAAAGRKEPAAPVQPNGREPPRRNLPAGRRRAASDARRLHLGRRATEDGDRGLGHRYPSRWHGTAAKARARSREGEVVYTENCASCHGDFGEGIDRWPVLAGGMTRSRPNAPKKRSARTGRICRPSSTMSAAPCRSAMRARCPTMTSMR